MVEQNGDGNNIRRLSPKRRSGVTYAELCTEAYKQVGLVLGIDLSEKLQEFYFSAAHVKTPTITDDQREIFHHFSHLGICISEIVLELAVGKTRGILITDQVKLENRINEAIDSMKFLNDKRLTENVPLGTNKEQLRTLLASGINNTSLRLFGDGELISINPPTQKGNYATFHHPLRHRRSASAAECRYGYDHPEAILEDHQAHRSRRGIVL